MAVIFPSSHKKEKKTTEMDYLRFIPW